MITDDGKIKVIEEDKKLSSPAEQMKRDLLKAFEEVKLHQQGKHKLKGLSEVLDEL